MRPLTAATLASASLILLSGCARYAPNLAVTGSDVQYQPTLESAGINQRAYRFTVTAPRPEYLTSVIVMTGASARVITADADTATTATAVGKGTHQLLLADARYLQVTVSEGRHIVRRPDGAVSDDTGRPVAGYAVVVATENPIALAQVQASLDTVDLRGPALEVLSRVAQAVASVGVGRWGAAVHHLETLGNGI